MDFKKFGNFVLLLGLLVLSVGGFKWLSNQHNPEARFYEGRQQENWVRGANRHDAIKIMTAGVVVALIGIGTSYSARIKK